jgi:hypothetical protein
MLCTWDPALVTGDIRVDKLGVDVELMAVPWYAQTPKDISAMYACCSYGKQLSLRACARGYLSMLILSEGYLLEGML